MRDIEDWVNEGGSHKEFRQTVHIVLSAISGSTELRMNMVMKGGILMALAYQSSRYTKDIDFSTSTRRDQFSIEDFRKTLIEALARAVERSGYSVTCRVQKMEQQPPGPERTFPTIRVNIGYANRGKQSEMNRLRAGRATRIVQLDYSLNEPIIDTDVYILGDDDKILTYGLVDLVAEKYRAILQQKGCERGRVRRQDVYDIHVLLVHHAGLFADLRHERILASLQEKSRARGLIVRRAGLRDPEIRERSRREYATLAEEIEGDLPDFDEAYAVVQAFYEGLPWNNA